MARIRNNRAALVVAASGWVVALGAAAVLTYDLNRPLSAGRVPPEMAARASPEPAAATAAAEPPEPDHVLNMPMITIYGTARPVAR